MCTQNLKDDYIISNIIYMTLLWRNNSIKNYEL